MSVALASIFLLSFRALHVQAAVSVSFSSYSAYVEQRDCVKLCLWHVSALDDLIAMIGCSPPWVNECFCNAELASSASDFLSACVASRCAAPKTAPAVTSALSAYNDYCSANGFSIPTIASIQSYSAFVSLSSCAQQCVWNSAHSSSADLMPAIGCQVPWDNACLCNSAVASTAGAFLSACVASRCSADTDAPQVTEAISVHGAYCSAAGLPIPMAVVTTQGTSTESQSREVASTRPPTVTAAASGQSSGTALSTGTIAGIAIGSVAGIAVLIASVVFIMCKRRKQSAKPVPLTVIAGQHPPPPWMYEKPTDPVAVEAGSGVSQRRHELSSGVAQRHYELPS
ncbi:hypothetical protein C8A00DRAFT_12857 [Chaetomidium leptoderma]|uniref:CFEM domain-containing protein n=1 Tax=Chaetomidium leptoderma TaxID=669021 RepID=A0AAN6VSR2_9PEZI|nr:hypothetical protein C8A00DRAFT_12857 [Chaetomidium leptoderma]